MIGAISERLCNIDGQGYEYCSGVWRKASLAHAHEACTDICTLGTNTPCTDICGTHTLHNTYAPCSHHRRPPVAASGP